jgi:glucose/arabinose dehydrogenase
MTKKAIFGFVILASVLSVVGVVLATIQGGSGTAETLNISVEPVATGFGTIMKIANAGDERLFVAEREGVIKMIDADRNVSVFADVSDRIEYGSDFFDERGLLGLAFHPDYATNGDFFISYTDQFSQSVVSRINLNGGSGISETVVLTVTQPFHNNNAGDINFGTDGYLYIALGDGGYEASANVVVDPFHHGQNPITMLATILRIDVDGSIPYGIPADNPFAGNLVIANEIWAFGVRNPWRFSIDRATGDLWLGDVGQNDREEINYLPFADGGGQNLGWSCYEGDLVVDGATCSQLGTWTLPVLARDRSDGNCATTGGYVYRGTQFPVLNGHYIFGDFCETRLRSLKPDGNGGWIHSTTTADLPFGIITFGEDGNGELYAGTFSDGTVYQIIAGNSYMPILHTD